MCKDLEISPHPCNISSPIPDPHLHYHKAPFNPKPWFLILIQPVRILVLSKLLLILTLLHLHSVPIPPLQVVSTPLPETYKGLTMLLYKEFSPLISKLLRVLVPIKTHLTNPSGLWTIRLLFIQGQGLQAQFRLTMKITSRFNKNT